MVGHHLLSFSGTRNSSALFYHQRRRMLKAAIAARLAPGFLPAGLCACRAGRPSPAPVARPDPVLSMDRGLAMK
jgi:hypothetical protein